MLDISKFNFFFFIIYKLSFFIKIAIIQTHTVVQNCNKVIGLVHTEATHPRGDWHLLQTWGKPVDLDETNMC